MIITGGYKKNMYYINTKKYGSVETVDETDNWKDAKYLIKEYCLASPEMGYYLSQRSTKDWRQK